jgi:hypothetical protein
VLHHKGDMVEDGLMECALEGNPGGMRLSRCYHVTRVMSGEMGNLVMKVDMKENVEEGSMMANTELLEAWISSSKANSVSDKAIRLPGCPRCVQVIQSHLGQTNIF